MKNTWLYIFPFALAIISCKENKGGEIEMDREVYTPVYSDNFKIMGSEDTDNTMIYVYNPWQGAEDVSSSFLIARDGEVPENYQGQFITKEPERIVCMSSTHISMLEALGAQDRIAAVSGLQYVSSDYVRSKSEEIPDIGYEGNIDYEKLIAVNPDLVLLFSVNGASSMEPKLNELGIPYLYVGDYVEESPLGKTEWLVPVAEVLGLREAGEEKLRDIAERYEATKAQVKDRITERPKVMVNAPFLDSWFMPSTESYVARMINDAGGDYIYGKNTGNSSRPIDMEEALILVEEADYWINIGTVTTKSELENQFPKFKEARCVREGRIFNNNKLRSPGGGNDCYESGVIHPDEILLDMAAIFHPEFGERELKYYHRLQ